jgi:hypothetical protein
MTHQLVTERDSIILPESTHFHNAGQVVPLQRKAMTPMFNLRKPSIAVGVAALGLILSLAAVPAAAGTTSAGEKAMVDDYKKAMSAFEAALGKCLVHDNDTGDRSTCVSQAKQSYRTALMQIDQKYN